MVLHLGEKLHRRNKQVSLHYSVGRWECCFLSGAVSFMLVPFSFALIRFSQELQHDYSNPCGYYELQWRACSSFSLTCCPCLQPLTLATILVMWNSFLWISSAVVWPFLSFPPVFIQRVSHVFTLQRRIQMISLTSTSAAVVSPSDRTAAPIPDASVVVTDPCVGTVKGQMSYKFLIRDFGSD